MVQVHDSHIGGQHDIRKSSIDHICIWPHAIKETEVHRQSHKRVHGNGFGPQHDGVMMSVHKVYNAVQMTRSINSQECKSIEIDAVTIKKSMTEYHHLINDQAYLLF